MLQKNPQLLKNSFPHPQKNHCFPFCPLTTGYTYIQTNAT